MIHKINRIISSGVFVAGTVAGAFLLVSSVPEGDWEWIAIGLADLILCPVALWLEWRRET